MWGYGPRRPRRTPEPPAPTPAALAMLTEEQFGARTFAPSGGEALPAVAAPPPPVMQLGIVIPDPPWKADPFAALGQAPPSPDRVDALAELQAADGEDFDPPAPGPPVKYEPVVPPAIPAADWRAEEVERARRDRRPPPMDEPAGSLDSRPAKRAELPHVEPATTTPAASLRVKIPPPPWSDGA